MFNHILCILCLLLLINDLYYSVDEFVMTVPSANGATKSITLRKVKKVVKEDGDKNYGHLVLELGLLFKALLDLCNTHSKERGLKLLTLAMSHFNANNGL